MNLDTIDTSNINLKQLNALIEDRKNKIAVLETEIIAYIVLRGKVLRDLEKKNKESML